MQRRVQKPIALLIKDAEQQPRNPQRPHRIPNPIIFTETSASPYSAVRLALAASFCAASVIRYASKIFFTVILSKFLVGTPNLAIIPPRLRAV
jgi:hypothetical protein